MGFVFHLSSRKKMNIGVWINLCIKEISTLFVQLINCTMEKTGNREYTNTELESISHILKSSWRNDLSRIKNRSTQKSILLIVDDNKLICIDTRKIRKSMETAGFDESYIAVIQNHKRVLSNNEARPKYNARRRENRNLEEIRRKLRSEKAELLKEIRSLRFHINYPYGTFAVSNPSRSD